MFSVNSKFVVLRRALCLCFLAVCLPGNVNAILNGVHATIDMFPEMVQLSQRYYRSFVCAGFLVTDRHVVTAAHCLVGDDDGNYRKVIANATYSMEGGIERDIEAFYVPSGYNSDLIDWDVAVIKLMEPFPLGKGIQVAKMSDRRWGKQEILRIAGWGVTEVGGNTAEQLITASVNTISDIKCEQRMHTAKDKDGKYVFENFYFTDTMSCALSKGHVDTCGGDSGGPVYIDKEVSGIVSWGIGCGHGKRPSIYTSVAKTRKFINAALCHKASNMEVENLQLFIPELLCQAVPGVAGISFYVYIPGTVKVVNTSDLWKTK